MSKSMRQTAFLLIAPALLGVLALFGCGKSDQKPIENLVPVSGKAMFMDKPEAGIQVIFNPVRANTKSHGGTGFTDSDGEFQIKNYMKLDGLPPGDYAVTFSWMETTGSGPTKNQPLIPGVTEKEKIPPLWNDLKKQGRHNFVTVPEAGKEDFEFKITGK